MSAYIVDNWLSGLGESEGWEEYDVELERELSCPRGQGADLFTASFHQVPW
jgi:hypothetical protein